MIPGLLLFQFRHQIFIIFKVIKCTFQKFWILHFDFLSLSINSTLEVKMLLVLERVKTLFQVHASSLDFLIEDLVLISSLAVTLDAVGHCFDVLLDLVVEAGQFQLDFV